MKGQALWDELERRGRKKYGLSKRFTLRDVKMRPEGIAFVTFAWTRSWRNEIVVNGLLSIDPVNV